MMRLVPRHKREAMQSRSSLEGTAVALGRRAGLPGLPDWEFIPTPGHTPGHVSYLQPARVHHLEPPGRRGVGSQAGAAEPDGVAGGHGVPMAGARTPAAVKAFAEQIH